MKAVQCHCGLGVAAIAVLTVSFTDLACAQTVSLEGMVSPPPGAAQV